MVTSIFHWGSIISGYGVSALGFYFFYHTYQDVKHAGMVFLVSAFFSWYDFGFFRTLQFRMLKEGNLNLPAFYTLLMLSAVSTLAISSLLNEYQFHSFMLAALASITLLGIRSIYDISGKSFEITFMINVVTGLSLLYDSFLMGEFGSYYYRALVVFIFSLIVLGIPKIIHITSLKHSYLEVLSFQTCQIIPANLERLYTLNSGTGSGTTYFLAELLNRFVPVIGQFLNSLFFKKLHLSYNTNLSILVISLSSVSIFLQSEMLALIMIATNSILAVALYLNLIYSNKMSSLKYVYFMESILCVILISYSNLGLIISSCIRITVDHLLLLICNRSK